ncbi:hypothetical protein [Streptomyces albogriseolus]|uniref:hypothetical protein n=1 Tax=Streptomyces albogriseolus TaxID=1887 RepID=UPI00345FA3E9
MAGRCGCGGTCACELQVAAPLKLVGTGTPITNPWKLSLDVGGKTGCAAITACVANSLGPGLVYDAATQKIMVRLSRDSGQAARFGTDQGILVTDGGGATPETCMRSIASLPAAPNVVGAGALAALIGPYSSPHQVDYCLAHELDMIHFNAATTADDVGVVTDYADHKISAARTSLYVTQDVRQLSAATVKTVLNYAGDENDPRSFSWGEGITTAQRTDRRGGWYGWLAPRYYQPLVSEFLRKIDGKSVALIDCVPDPLTGVYPEEDMMRGPIYDVLAQCAQPWAMIGVSELPNATTVLNYGLTPILIPQHPGTANTTTLPYAVADLQQLGVQWLALSDQYADSVFAAYVGAGLQVLMRGNSRHSQHTRISALGVRGALQYDPVYYRGPGTKPELNAKRGYRSESDAWEHRRMSVGQLTHRTDIRNIVSSGGYSRGRTETQEQGLILPAGFGELPIDGPRQGISRPAVLCGWECPILNPTSYTITWEMKWNTLASESPATAKMGLLFGAATDEDPFSWPADATLNPTGMPNGQRTMYRAYQRQSGQIEIAKWASPTAEVEYLATATGPAIAAGFYNTYTLTVTPTQITFTRTRTDGAKHTATVADAQYRGPYFFLEKEETFLGAGPAQNRFEGKFRNLSYTPGP